jgi:hypothetical protein
VARASRPSTSGHLARSVPILWPGRPCRLIPIARRFYPQQGRTLVRAALAGPRPRHRPRSMPYKAAEGPGDWYQSLSSLPVAPPLRSEPREVDGVVSGRCGRASDLFRSGPDLNRSICALLNVRKFLRCPVCPMVAMAVSGAFSPPPISFPYENSFLHALVKSFCWFR